VTLYILVFLPDAPIAVTEYSIGLPTDRQRLRITEPGWRLYYVEGGDGGVTLLHANRNLALVYEKGPQTISSVVVGCEDTEPQLMVPNFVAERRLSPIVAGRLCLGRVFR
jgi:hypothetical protein